MIEVSLALTAFLLIGLPIAALLHPRAPRALLISESALFGAATCAATMFALSFVHLWTRSAVAVLLAIIAGVFWILAFRRGAFRRSVSAREATTIVEKATAAVADVLLMTAIVGHAFFATAASLWEWDFWAIWGLKGRVFWEHGSVDWQFLREPLNSFVHPDYPLMMPMMFDFVALIGGRWNDVSIGLIYTFLCGAALLAFRSLVLDETGSQVGAAISALAVSGVVLSTPVGLADGPLMIYGGVGLLLLRRGLVYDDHDAFGTGAVILGIATQMKNEGLALLCAALATLLFLRRWREATRLWPAALIAASWMAIRTAQGLSTDIFSGESVAARAIAKLQHPGDLLAALASNLPQYPVLWLVMIVAIAISGRALLARERFLIDVAALQILFYVASYVVGPHEFDWHITNSWRRLVSHIVLPVAFIAAVALITMVRQRAADRDSAAQA